MKITPSDNLTELETKLLDAVQKLTSSRSIAEQKYWKLFLKAPYTKSLKRKKHKKVF